MCTLAVHWGWLDTVPGFPDRLRENPPRQGFFEHPEYLAVRAHLPAPWQDILDLAYYSGWRKQEILGLTWDEIDEAGGVIRLSPARSKTLVGTDSPHLAPHCRGLGATAGTPRTLTARSSSTATAFLSAAGARRGAPPARPLGCQLASSTIAAAPPARNLIRANVPERVAMLLTGHKSRAIFDRYNIINEQELLDAGDPAGRLSGAGGTSPSAAPPGRSRRPAHRITPPPRATHHRVRRAARLAHRPQVYEPARDRGTRGDGRADAAEHGHAQGPAALLQRNQVGAKRRQIRQAA